MPELPDDPLVIPRTTRQIRRAIAAAGVPVDLVKEGAYYVFVQRKPGAKIGRVSGRIRRLGSLSVRGWVDAARACALHDKF